MEILYLVLGIILYCCNLILYYKLFNEIDKRFSSRIRKLELEVFK